MPILTRAPLAGNTRKPRPAFAVLHQGMVAQNCLGLAQVVMHGREQLIEMLISATLDNFDLAQYKDVYTEKAFQADRGRGRRQLGCPMAYWLFKEEPEHYSIEQLFRDKRTVWDGVENNLALKHLRSVQKGDRVFSYHTGKDKAVVGVMEVVKGPYRDPRRDDERFVVVDVKPVRRLDRPVSLAEIKANPKFADFALVRISRLSVMPVTEDQWAEIEHLAKQGS